MNTSYDILFQIQPRSSDHPETYDAKLMEFGHYLIPLLPAPGTVRDWTIDAVCCLAERIYRPVFMMCRQEIAVLPLEPDFVSNAPGLANLRKALWEMIEDATRLRWIILTRLPENIVQSLPPNWGGKGYGNVCLGIVVDNTAGFPRQLNELRNTVARFRMLLITPSAQGINLTGCLDKIDWVVFAGNSGDVQQAAAMEAVCRAEGVAFYFHEMDKTPSTFAHDEPQPDDNEMQWPKHPFGTAVKLDRPAHPSLKPALDALQELLVPRTTTSPQLENKPTHTMSEAESQSPAPTIMSESTDHKITAEFIINHATPGNGIPASMTHEHQVPVQLGIPPLPEEVMRLSSTQVADATETSEALVVTPGARPQEHIAVPVSGSSIEHLKSPAKPPTKDARKYSPRRNAVVDIPAHDLEVTEIMAPINPGELSVDDLAYRKEREAVVTAGVNSCIAAGRALFEIKTYHDGSLWKEFHSFEEYCRAKWNYQKSQAYRLVDTGEFITDLETGHSPRGENMPVNEGQVRPLLANVPRELRVECWQQIVKEKPSAELTSTIVGTEVRKFLMEKGIETMRLKSTKVTEKSTDAAGLTITLREVEHLLNLALFPCPDDSGGNYNEIILKIHRRRPGKPDPKIRVIEITAKIWTPDAVAS